MAKVRKAVNESEESSPPHTVSLWTWVKNFLYSTWKGIAWLAVRFWDWDWVAAVVGTVCIGVSIVLAQYAFYLAANVLLVFGAVLLAVRIVFDIFFRSNLDKTGRIAASLIASGTIGLVAYLGWYLVDQIRWKNEVVISTVFKSSSLFTEKRKRDVTWDLNEYYLYLKKVGFNLPTDIPPLGLTPKGSEMMAGGSGGPTYFSSLFVTEDMVDDSNAWRSIYSTYTFNRNLVWPDAFRTGISRVEADHDEEAAWIYTCYFSSSFAGRRVCNAQSPGHDWTDAMWDIRSKYGQDYTDGLMCYAELMWGSVPSKYLDSFDKFFRYKLASGESVKGSNVSSPESFAIFKQHGIDLSPPW